MQRIDPESFGNSVLQTIYHLDEFHFKAPDALRCVLAEIDELKALNSAQVLESRHNYFQIPKAMHEDYRERFFEVRPGGFALAGIRHVNGEKNQPFVHMLLGFLPTHADLDRIGKISTENFKLFSPKHVSIWLRPSSIVAQELEKRGFAARRYIVGNVKSISTGAVPAGYERITLEKMNEAPNPQWCEDAYAEFHHTYPALASWVPVTDREELQNCASDGLLYRVRVDGDQAGIIGGRREPLLGLSGVYMTEILLTTPYRRRGLAQALQRRFLGHLNSDIELIWGTIDARNIPSTRTALKIGRKPIRTEFFVPLG